MADSADDDQQLFFFFLKDDAAAPDFEAEKVLPRADQFYMFFLSGSGFSARMSGLSLMTVFLDVPRIYQPGSG